MTSNENYNCVNASVSSIKQIAENIFELNLVFQTGNEFNPAPGQFFMLKFIDTTDPLLPRPFSIYSFSQQGDQVSLTFVFLKTGKGTSSLSKLKKNDNIYLFGPLGNGFNLKNNHKPVFVAGGIGLAGLNLLIEKYLKSYSISAKSKPILIFGAKSENLMFNLDNFQNENIELILTTDDGTAGIKGFVTNPLNLVLKKENNVAVYACGPTPMLKSVQEVAAKYNIPAQLSLEAHMACGIGVCRGCVCMNNKKNKYLSVCKEGPVFDSNLISL